MTITNRTRMPTGRQSEVENPVPQENPFFAVDRAWSGLHSLSFQREEAELDLLSVFPGATPPLGFRRLWRRIVGHAVAPDTADEMIVPDDETLDHRAGGVIGIGDEVEGIGYLQGSQKQHHLVEECPLVPVRENDAFVDPAREGNGKDTFESPGENRNGL